MRGARGAGGCAAAASRGACWLWGAAGFGVAFLLAQEPRLPDQGARAGYDPTTIKPDLHHLLTGFTSCVLAAVLLLAGIVRLAPRRQLAGATRTRRNRDGVSGHMVDLLWVVLFPLV